MDSTDVGRAVSPLLGVILLIAITVLLAVVVAAGASSLTTSSAPPSASFDLAVDGEASRLVLEHTGGDPIDIEAVTMTVAVEGTPLERQPPVPYAGASGFYGSPEGPFNVRSDRMWRAGERASVRVASTNDPVPSSGETVTVELFVDDRPIASLETVAT